MQEAFKTLEKNGLKIVAVTGSVFSEIMERQFAKKKYMTRKDICEYLNIGLTTLEGRIRRNPQYFKVVKKGARRKGEKTLYDKHLVKAYKAELQRLGKL